MTTIIAILLFVVAAAAGQDGIHREDKRNHSDFDNCLFKGCAESGILENDIIVSKFNYKETAALYGFQPKVRQTRAAERKGYKQWPKKGNFVTIPYTFQGRSITAWKRRAILRGIEEFWQKTCIRFVPRTKEHHYIEFRGSGGCQSYVGMQDYITPQPVRIGYNCESKGVVIHELMHAVGFHHEQSRSDRDKYVKIHWNNIIQEKKKGFRKETTSSFGSPYDYRSVMHYGSYLFSKNGKPTITDLKGKALRTQLKNFSVQDLIQINKKYGCKVPAKGWPPGPIPTFETRTTTARPGAEDCNDKSSMCYEPDGGPICRIPVFILRNICLLMCGHCVRPDEDIIFKPRTTARPRSKPRTTAKPRSKPRTTARPRGKACINKISTCATLKNRNYCRTSKPYMRKYCPDVCGFCRKPGPITKVPPTKRPRITARPKPTTRPQGKACVDKLSSCSTLKKRNYCTISRTYMRKNCPKICGFCRKTGPVNKAPPPKRPHITARPKPTTRPQGKACINKLSSCSTLKKRNYCTISRTYMRTNCPKICGFCRKTGPVTKAPPPKRPRITARPKPTTRPQGKACVNKLSSCSTLKKRNYCTISKTYMRKNCPKICGFCRKSGPVTKAPPTKRPRITARPKPTTRPQEKSCEDKLSTCTTLKKRNFCVISKSYMRNHCGSTCGFCRKSENPERTTTRVQTTTPAPKPTTIISTEVTSTTVQPFNRPETTLTSQNSTKSIRTTIVWKTVMATTRKADITKDFTTNPAPTKPATTKNDISKAATPEAATSKATLSRAVTTDISTTNFKTGRKATDTNSSTKHTSTTTGDVLTTTTSAPAITKQSLCRDAIKNCSNYVKAGMCTRQRYKNWMSGKCQKSCKLCTST